jgi:hypothetical protein
MAINFPNAPLDGELFTDPNGLTWFYDAATNSWTAEGANMSIPDIYIQKNLELLSTLP